MSEGDPNNSDAVTNNSVEAERGAMATGAEKRGQYYWRVVGAVGDIHLFADTVEIVGGALVFKQKDHVNFAVAVGCWRHFYAASVLDGGAIAVEHWTNAGETNGKETF